jgi:predicted DNA-binding protein
MEVHLTPEREVQLRQLATRTGRNTAQLVEEAVDRLLEDDAQFRLAIRDGFDAIDRGHFIEEEQMDLRITRMLQS